MRAKYSVSNCSAKPKKNKTSEAELVGNPLGAVVIRLPADDRLSIEDPTAERIINRTFVDYHLILQFFIFFVWRASPTALTAVSSTAGATATTGATTTRPTTGTTATGG
jgi:hypothetical protein